MGGIIQPRDKASWSENELKYFRILVNYPSFEEPIILNEFASFDEGLETIQKNLQARKGNAVKVYQQIFKDKKTAVFGIGLLDPNRGETTFLKALGEDNIAALPYEIILEDNKASILDGKFWFPFYWSNLSMKELKAIRRVPNDVEYIMKGLTKK